ncbi:MAG: TOBE domain-containing protein [Methanoculleus sp.]|uniref:TOBE domain-containing protein n=1 Tax=unclassified Methanoculleus TaxID=2619537 RepID=UPI0025D74937|nr:MULTISPECIES: TOBE domain-containing protein [unclassified Methanoculleus]MDD2253367.1 TOBE domain-containing protein [Methanoculleus sp.]MDD2787001.1 TOBE domain-containing protein [Methanoculleus sp.]MDD3216381.1 TOBE domain-containing protein [Methanoculleus sp.]MDD4314365.1 TOBE domain-containing protein [Methanoculleus sp.]MDD4470697.1 TOBE domain-containing protein [Methanoculleus sp.]
MRTTAPGFQGSKPSGDGELIAVITKKSVENLGLAVGKKVYAGVKSTDVMVATD